MFTQIQKSVLFLSMSICGLSFTPVQCADDVTARNAQRRLAKLCHQLMPSLKDRQPEAGLSLDCGYQILDEVRMQVRGSHPGRHLIPLPPGCQLSPHPVLGKTIGSYGNKYDNLRILQEASLDIEAGFNVPAFKGISSEKVRAFIEKSDPSVIEDWKRAGETFAALGTLQDPAIKALLQNIASKITALFSSIEPTSLFDEASLTWFASVKEAGNMLMVRSTGGGEDGEKSPLAGCNESPAYISPEPDAVGAAMGVVLESYFSEQSLKTRLATGANPFDENLLIPVLFHELIGEQIGGEKNHKNVPISGVMFTNRRDLADDPATRITTVTATFGHGEGAVANRAPCDSYHMTASKVRSEELIIVPHIAHKNVRILPAREGGRVILCPGKNPDVLAMSSALTPNIAAELFDIGRRIEELYGMPMDVEFVVKNNVVFIVQARPLEKALAQPRCVVIDQEVDTSAFVRCELSLDPITLGADMLTIISDSSQILTAKTLDEADRDPRCAECLVAVSEKAATALSHPAINFSSRGVPTFYTKNLSLFEAMVARAQEEGLTLVFDAQNHRVLLWDTNAQVIEPFIRNEWRDHPVEGGTSFYLNRYEQIFGSMYDGELHDEEERLLQVIAHGNSEQAADAVTHLKAFAFEQLAIVHEFASDSGFSFAHDEYIRNLCTEGKLQLQVLFDEIVHHIARPGHSKLIRLYYVKKLSELLFGSSEEGTHLGSLGIAHYPQLLGCVHLGSELHTEDECALLALYAKQAPLSPEGMGNWRAFVQVLQQEASANPEVAEHVATLSSMLKMYAESGALPAWFYTNFFPTFHKEATIPEKLAELLTGYSETSKAFLVKIEEYSLELSSLQRSVSDCSKPSKIGTFWAKLKRLALAVSGDEYCTRFKSQPASVQNVACSFMHGLVALFDEAIKTMKSSSAFSDRQKVQHMKVYINDYFTLLKIWGRRIMPEGALNYHPDWSLERYLTTVGSFFSQLNEFRLGSAPLKLVPSPNFSVNAAVLGSRTAFDRHIPQTIEDIFTLVHQNLLVVLGAIQKHCVIVDQKIWLPGVQIGNISDEFQRRRNPGRFEGMRRIGVVVKPQTYKLTFNLPIRNHSAMIELMYDAKEQKTYMTVRFLGQARGRWREMVHLAYFMGWITGEPLAEGPDLNENSGEVSWCLDVTNVTIYQDLCDCLEMGIQISDNSTFQRVFGRHMRPALLRAALPELPKALAEQNPAALTVFEAVVDNPNLVTELQPIATELLRNLPSNIDPIVHMKLLAISAGTTLEAVKRGGIPQDPVLYKRLLGIIEQDWSNSVVHNHEIRRILETLMGMEDALPALQDAAPRLLNKIKISEPGELHFKLRIIQAGTTWKAVLRRAIPQDPALYKRLLGIVEQDWSNNFVGNHVLRRILQTLMDREDALPAVQDAAPRLLNKISEHEDGELHFKLRIIQAGTTWETVRREGIPQDPDLYNRLLEIVEQDWLNDFARNCGLRRILETLMDREDALPALQDAAPRLLNKIKVSEHGDRMLHSKLRIIHHGTTLEAVMRGDIPQDPALYKCLVNVAHSIPSRSNRCSIIKGLMSSEVGAKQIIAQREGLTTYLMEIIRYQDFFRYVQVATRETFFECAVSDIHSSNKYLRELAHTILVSLAENGYEVDRILQIAWEVYKKHPKTGAALIFELAQKGIGDSLWVKLLGIRLGYAALIKNHPGMIRQLGKYVQQKFEANMLNKILIITLAAPGGLARSICDRGVLKTFEHLSHDTRRAFSHIGNKIQELCGRVRSRL